MHLPSNLAQNQDEWLQLVLVFLEKIYQLKIQSCFEPREYISRIYNPFQKGNEGDLTDDEWTELKQQIWDTVEFIKPFLLASNTPQDVVAA